MIILQGQLNNNIDSNKKQTNKKTANMIEDSVRQAISSILHVLVQLLLPRTLGGKHGFYSHLTDGETDTISLSTQRGMLPSTGKHHRAD